MNDTNTTRYKKTGFNEAVNVGMMVNALQESAGLTKQEVSRMTSSNYTYFLTMCKNPRSNGLSQSKLRSLYMGLKKQKPELWDKNPAFDVVFLKAILNL